MYCSAVFYDFSLKKNNTAELGLGVPGLATPFYEQ
jgi:hypothetical protein